MVQALRTGLIDRAVCINYATGMEQGKPKFVRASGRVEEAAEEAAEKKAAEQAAHEAPAWPRLHTTKSGKLTRTFRQWFKSQWPNLLHGVACRRFVIVE